MVGLGVAGVLLLAGALRFAPLSWARIPGSWLGWLAGGVLRIRRKHVEEALARAGVGEPEQVAARMYAQLGCAALELLACAVRPRSASRGRVDLERPEVAHWLARPGGAIVVSAHTVGWDQVAMAVAGTRDLTVVTKRLSVGVLDALWQRIRVRSGVRLSEVGRAAGEIRGALGRGELVAMMIDQAPERDRGVLRCDFLGAPAWVDLAPALLAARARVPLVAAFPLRLPDGRYTLDVRGVSTPGPGAGRAWAEQATRDVTAWLEESIRERPQDWLWMHRRWKGLPGRVDSRPVLLP